MHDSGTEPFSKVRDHLPGDALWPSLARRARVEGLGVWQPLLDDMTLYKSAPDGAQDQAIKLATQILGPAFRFCGTTVFCCGEQRHRLASYQFLGDDPDHQPVRELETDWIFRLIPGGVARLGSSESEDLQGSEGLGSVQHVRLSPCLVGATAMTVGMWRSLDLFGSSCDGDDASIRASPCEPLVNIDLPTIGRVLLALGGELDLPREAEWEYACRGGSDSLYFWGEDASAASAYLNFDEAASISDFQVRGVARRSPNAFGLYDMVGGVFEWCAERDSQPRSSRFITRLGEARSTARGPWSHFIYRGGPANSASELRSTRRGSTFVGRRLENLGFRFFRRLRPPRTYKTTPFEVATPEPSINDISFPYFGRIS